MSAEEAKREPDQTPRYGDDTDQKASGCDDEPDTHYHSRRRTQNAAPADV